MQCFIHLKITREPKNNIKYTKTLYGKGQGARKTGSQTTKSPAGLEAGAAGGGSRPSAREGDGARQGVSSPDPGAASPPPSPDTLALAGAPSPHQAAICHRALLLDVMSVDSLIRLASLFQAFTFYCLHENFPGSGNLLPRSECCLRKLPTLGTCPWVVCVCTQDTRGAVPVPVHPSAA